MYNKSKHFSSLRVKRECLPALSEQTGVHIIAGTAFYVDTLMSEEVKRMTVEEVCITCLEGSRTRNTENLINLVVE